MSERPAADTIPPGRADRTLTVAAWLACTLVAPFAFRAVLLIDAGALQPGLDGRGFASDTAAALGVAAAAMALSRLRRRAAFVLVGVWFALCAGNAEHVLVNGANVGAAHAGFLTDATFVFGSALRPTLPLPLALTAGVTGLLAWRATRGVAAVRPILLTAAAGVLLGGALLAWPIDLATAEWRQAGPLEANLRPSRPAPALAIDARAPLPAPLERREPADLSGVPVVRFPSQRPNVLLVMLEGISGAHIEAIATANGATASPALPRLDELASRHLHYTSLVAQQRQTNRGEYAVLCGDWPKLRSEVPRMSEMAAAPGPRCLPEALGDLGYETLYLQAAPLGFMMKDQFMARIGFDRVLGNAWFKAARSRTNWGVDDATLFDGAMREIQRLDALGRPWMVTLLTVGTHHPYNVPDDYEGPSGTRGFDRAAHYADRALGDFVDALGEHGLLDRTLVLITTDESRGLPDGAAVAPLELLLSRSWSFLIVMAPGVEAGRVDAPFLQSDLALSVLDYVSSGADDGAVDERAAGGRSVFRHYADGRRIAFGNTYQQRIVAVDPSGAIDVCRENLSVCTRFSGAAGRPFQAGTSPLRDLEREEREELASWLFARAEAPDVSGSARETPLIGDADVPVLTGPARFQLVFGGQGLEAPAGARVSVTLDVTLHGERGHATVRTNLIAGDEARPLFVEEARLEPGDRLVVDYSVEAGSALHDLESRFVVIDRSGEGLHLSFERARVGIEAGGPASGGAHRVNGGSRIVPGTGPA